MVPGLSWYLGCHGTWVVMVPRLSWYLGFQGTWVVKVPGLCWYLSFIGPYVGLCLNLGHGSDGEPYC